MQNYNLNRNSQTLRNKFSFRQKNDHTYYIICLNLQLNFLALLEGITLCDFHSETIIAF